MLFARAAIACLVAFSLSCASTAPAPASTPSAPSDARCAIWDREVSFAKSVQDHDATAFAQHVLAGAVFVGGEGTLRGRDAIAKGWSDIIRGEGLHLDWHPAEVVVTSDPHVAMSRGPVWIEATAPSGAKKLLIGTFQSTWVLDKDGVWRVAVDGGGSTKEATEEEVAKSRAAAPSTCAPEAH